MTDNTQPAAGSTHIIRYALEMGLLWIDGDGRDKVREALDALDTLEAQLASIGAGGVSALMGAAKTGSEPVATVFTLEAAAAELRRLHALTTQQQRDLIAESHRTAEQKLRADQMTTQHAHQAALNTEARAQLAAALTAQAISAEPAGAAAPQPAPPADSVQEDAAWMPLTPELLTAIESGNLGNRFWIAAHNSNEPQIGVYEWQQGRNPHGFNSGLSRYGASEITHVLPYKPPALPAALAARKQGATQ